MTPKEHVATIKNLWDAHGDPRTQTMAYAIATLIEHVAAHERHLQQIQGELDRLQHWGEQEYAGEDRGRPEAGPEGRRDAAGSQP